MLARLDAAAYRHSLLAGHGCRIISAVFIAFGLFLWLGLWFQRGFWLGVAMTLIVVPGVANELSGVNK